MKGTGCPNSVPWTFATSFLTKRPRCPRAPRALLSYLATCTPSPQTPHTHREHTIQAPMFEPLMQALDTTMTNGRTRKRYVNATWTQHGQWLQTRASPSFITFATPFSLSPSLPLLSPLPSLCLLLPPFFFFSPFWT